MARMRKLELAESTAYAQYRSAAADAALAHMDDSISDSEYARLARRAAAYRARWDAVARRLENETVRREAAS